jgi:hypothetical protein
VKNVDLRKETSFLWNRSENMRVRWRHFFYSIPDGKGIIVGFMLILNKRLNSIAYWENGIKMTKERTKRTILLALVSASRTVPLAPLPVEIF